MMKKLVTDEVDDEAGIACIRMARHNKRNAINLEMIEHLAEAVDQVRDRASVRAVVLSGGSFFSAGGDVSGLDEENDQQGISRSTRAGEDLCQLLATLPQPTIAAVEGGAIGGGISLAAFCDWRIMASSSWIWAPETAMGLFFGWRTLPRLTALIGPARAKTIAIRSGRHTAEQCFSWGFADQLAPDGESEAYAISAAKEIASKPKLATTLVKQAIEAATLNLRPTSDEAAVLAAYADQEGRTIRSRRYPRL